MNNSSKIIVQRDKIRPTYMFNKFAIIIDDKEIGEISNGETKEFEISNGKHTILVKTDYDSFPTPQNESSEPLTFSISSKDRIKFRCGVIVDTANILITILSPILSMLTKTKKFYLKIDNGSK